MVFVINQPPLANRRIRNAVQASVEEYLHDFMTDFSNAAIITFGGSKTTSKPLQLIPNDQIRRSQILSKIKSDIIGSSTTDFFSLQEAMKSALTVAKSSATSLQSIFVLTSNVGHNMSDLCNALRAKKGYFITTVLHVLHISTPAQSLASCTIDREWTYHSLRKYVSQVTSVLQQYGVYVV